MSKLNRRMFLRAMGLACAAPALTAPIGRAAQAKPEPVILEAKPNTPTSRYIAFLVQAPSSHKEILRLDAEGMAYKGVYVKDAGEAHWAFIETMRQLQQGMTRS